MPDDLDDLQQLILHAHSLMGAGRTVEAEQALASRIDLARSLGPHPLSMALFRLLGQCARTAGRYDDARNCYGTAFQIAAELQDPDMASAAAMGAATVELAEGNLTGANELYEAAVEFARAAGPGQGLASVLQGHAEVLHRLGDDSAADLYGEALTQPDINDSLRGVILDNLSQELHRQGRVPEAIDHTKAAIGVLGRSGAHFDVYKALLNLAALTRGTDDELSVKAFVQAHDLIHRLHADIDVAHYQGYQARAEAIEADTWRMAMAGELPELHPDGNAAGAPAEADVALQIGLHANAAARATEQGERLVMEHRYAEAMPLLREAEAYWQSLAAHHELPRIWSALGLLYMGAGDFDSARVLLTRARWQARQIGRAITEFVALLNLCVLAANKGDHSEMHLLELLAQARAVGKLVGTPDGGALDSIAADVCERNGATQLAADYVTRSIEAVQGRAEQDATSLNRLAQRLNRLAFLTGDFDGVVARLSALSVQDALVRFPVHSGLGTIGLARGEWTEQTLAYLRSACQAYEERRAAGGELGPDHAQTAFPPYAEAAELAVHLGQAGEAFTLMERWKSRSLLDDLRDYPPSADDPLLAEETELWNRLRALRIPDRDVPPAELWQMVRTVTGEAEGIQQRLERIWQTLPADFRTRRLAEPVTAGELPALLPDATLVEFLYGTKGIYAFTASATGVSATRVIEADDPALPQFLRLVLDDSPLVMGRLLEHPLYEKLTDAIGAADFVVPHGLLHRVPFPGRLLPSASVLRGAAKPAGGPVLVAGDPLGDLPYARSECAHVGERFGAEPVYGEDVTADWLASSLGSNRLVHLACHAEFNERRPDRSGLLFAGRTLLTPAQLGSLDWAGSIVVLSACHSGRHRVGAGDELAGLGRTLLAAGATALVVSVRAVPDLSTALLMTWFYDEIDPYVPLTADAVSKALAEAQRRVREVTAEELARWAEEHAAKGADHAVLGEALLTLARETQGRPFEDPAHWASFAVQGTG